MDGLPKVVEYDGLRFVRDSRGYYRYNGADVEDKIKGNRHRRLHQYVWIKEIGPIPRGMHVHHRFGDKHTTDVSRMELLSNSDHIRLHMRDPARRSWARENMIRSAIPAARAWHGTEEGLAWHRENGKKSWSEERKAASRTVLQCLWCGEDFVTVRPAVAKYCCSNHRVYAVMKRKRPKISAK